MAGADDAGGMARQQVLNYLARVETGLISGADALAAEINERRETPHAEGGWRSPAEARSILDDLEPVEAAAQFEWAAGQFVDDVATIPAIYHSLTQPEIEAPPIQPAVRKLLLSLHNPMVRESLLIPVADPWKDEVRELFADLAAVCWGFIEVTAGRAGPHHRDYLDHLAEMWNVDDVDRLADVLNLD